MDLITGIIVGIVLGGGALFFVLRDRTRQRDSAVGERDELRDALAQAKAEISGYQSTETAREKAFEERRTELDTHFKGLASDVLKSSTEEFRKQAAEQFRQHQELAGKDLKAREDAVENLVKPVRESLEKLREHVDASDKARGAETKLVSRSVEQLMTETSGLRKILHNPQLRGQWGEQHLRNVLDAAGMTSPEDYVEQDTVGSVADGARLRPDVVVNIPDGKKVVIDAKTPHERYDAALRCDDEQEQEELLKAHAAALASHAKTLAGRDYPQRIDGSLDFTMMYVPTEPMLDAAIKVEPTIWQDTWQRHRVLIATPGLLIAFLRTVALGWQQQNIQRNANEIAETARELFERLRTYSGHVDKMGRGLRQAVDAYNDGVGSFQSRVLVQARRFEELGAADKSKQIGEPAQVEKTVRQLDAPELPLAAGDDK
ncbi:MAG: DNA recombination protein RmuC [Acidobacteria bacterium]|nr:DNA recombination protein RmuC [Acidobacteriota bacterium]MYI74247.1 DNA recombination protein RmuC [Acidobacteriota bacterium]